MPLNPRSAMSSIARRSFPPPVIAAYPILITAGAAEMGVSKCDRSIGGYNGSRDENAAGGIAQLPATAVSPAMNSLRDDFELMDKRNLSGYALHQNVTLALSSMLRLPPAMPPAVSTLVTWPKSGLVRLALGFENCGVLVMLKADRKSTSPARSPMGKLRKKSASRLKKPGPVKAQRLILPRAPGVVGWTNEEGSNHKLVSIPPSLRKGAIWIGVCVVPEALNS